ncbi:MAG: AAA family ATPase [Clostridia bacterium]|nr:AAA family ATPase [Clostridia bacterium]
MGVIFITGCPGSGKSTVAALLHEKLKCPWFEFGWIPEFRQKNPHTEISYEEEEQISLENLLLVTDNYLRHGFDHVILTDIREPFTNTVYEHFSPEQIQLVTLIAEEEDEIRRRVLTRDNGNEYRNGEEAVELNRIFRARPVLPGEIRLFCDRMTAEEAAESVLAGLEPGKETP